MNSCQSNLCIMGFGAMVSTYAFGAYSKSSTLLIPVLHKERLLMNVVADFFKRLFGKKINIKQGNVSFTLDLSYTGAKLDKAQAALDAQVWSDMKQYMPYDSGTLIEQTERLNNSLHGEVYYYDPSLPYAHYQYEGLLYVEPEPYPQVGGFYNPSYGWWSIPGVTKVPTDIPLKYTSPTAVAHWGEVAYNNHHKQWVAVAKAACKKG